MNREKYLIIVLIMVCCYSGYAIIRKDLKQYSNGYRAAVDSMKVVVEAEKQKAFRLGADRMYNETIKLIDEAMREAGIK